MKGTLDFEHQMGREEAEVMAGERDLGGEHMRTFGWRIGCMR